MQLNAIFTLASAKDMMAATPLQDTGPSHRLIVHAAVACAPGVDVLGLGAHGDHHLAFELRASGFMRA